MSCDAIARLEPGTFVVLAVRVEVDKAWRYDQSCAVAHRGGVRGVYRAGGSDGCDTISNYSHIEHCVGTCGGANVQSPCKPAAVVVWSECSRRTALGINHPPTGKDEVVQFATRWFECRGSYMLRQLLEPFELPL